MRVLITGAQGHVAAQLVPLLRAHFDLTLVDLGPDHTSTRQKAADLPDDLVVADICDTATMVELLADADAVLHLAAQPRVAATWDELRRPNIDGVVSVFEAARIAGTKKVVFASTNHVTGMYDRDQEWPLSPDWPVRPDSLYGATKAFGEAVGRYYSDVHGLSVICLRIGWALSRPREERAWMWISPADHSRLVVAAVRSDVRFGIYYAVSADSRRRWTIDNAVRDLGYEPQDDAEDYVD